MQNAQKGERKGSQKANDATRQGQAPALGRALSVVERKTGPASARQAYTERNGGRVATGRRRHAEKTQKPPRFGVLWRRAGERPPKA